MTLLFHEQFYLLLASAILLFLNLGESRSPPRSVLLVVRLHLIRLSRIAVVNCLVDPIGDSFVKLRKRIPGPEVVQISFRAI